MGYYHNLAKQGYGLTVSSAGPLDDRDVVQDRKDLLTMASGSAVYKGMKVSVINGHAVYMLTDEAKASSPDFSGWKPVNDAWTPTYADTVKVNSGIGSVTDGTTVAELKNSTVSEIIEKMLFRDEFPAAPAHTVAFSGLPDAPVAGDAYTAPTVTAVWNTLVSPKDASGTAITVLPFTVTPAQTGYWAPGKVTFTCVYSYGAGSYTLMSTLGTTKGGILPAVTDASLTETRTVPMPWWAGGIRHTEQDTAEFTLSGTPALKLPAGTVISSFMMTQDGLSWLPVNMDGWPKTTEQVTLGATAYAYDVYTKQAAYAGTFTHRIKISFNV